MAFESAVNLVSVCQFAPNPQGPSAARLVGFSSTPCFITQWVFSEGSHNCSKIQLCVCIAATDFCLSSHSAICPHTPLTVCD